MHRHERRRDRERHRDQRPTPAKTGRGATLRFLVILGIGCVAALIITRSDFRHDRVVTPPGPVKMAKMSPRSLQEAAELNGIDGGAKAGQAALAQGEKVKPEVAQAGTVFIGTETTDANANVTKADPLHPQAAIRIVGVRSDKAYTNRADAIADAQRAARQRLAEVLQTLDPPIRVLPSDEQIAKDYIAANSAKDVPPSPEIRDAWKASNLDANRQWATVDVEVSESQLRNLRGKQRLLDLGWILGGLAGVLVAGYGVLKLDALAKNYFMKRAVPTPAV
jgi:hypothetical protein